MTAIAFAKILQKYCLSNNLYAYINIKDCHDVVSHRQLFLGTIVF